MKICHLTSVHPSTDIRIFIKECSSAAVGGFETHLVAVDTPEKVINAVNMHNVNKASGGRIARMTQTVWSVYKKAKFINADLYHFHDPELIPIGLLLRLQGKKVIYDVHEDVPRQILAKQWIKKPLRKLTSWLFEKIEDFAAKRFTAIVTATPFLAQRFIKLGCRVENINNFPILAEFVSVDIDWHKKEKLVAYLGGISEVRGIVQMVDSIEDTEAKLLLAGTFNSNLLRDKVSDRKGWNKVEELGHVDRLGVIKVLEKSIAGLVVLHPIINYLDSLPIKMFEYMSAGIPVIASDFPLWKEIIEGNNCGICVDPMDSCAIAKAINWIVEHPQEAELMGKNGRKVVAEKYNWEQENIKLLRLYTELSRNE